MYYGDYNPDHEFEEGYLSSEETIWVRDANYGSNPNKW